jgi:hypothetical protein
MALGTWKQDRRKKDESHPQSVIDEPLTDVVMKLSDDPASFLLLCLDQLAAHGRKRRFPQLTVSAVAPNVSVAGNSY